MTATPDRLFTGPFAALFAAALAFFTAGGLVLPVTTAYGFGPLGADAAGVGIAFGAFAIASLLMRPIVGQATDRYGRRPVLIIGGVITVIALAGHLFADTLPLFIVVRAGLGIGEACFFVAAIAAISDLAPPARRGEAINLASIAVYVGLGVGPWLGEVALAAWDFRGAWLAAAALAILATGLTLLIPETAPGLDRPPSERPRSRLVHPAGLLPGFLILTGTFGMAGFFAFLPRHGAELGLTGVGPIVGLYAVIVIVLRLVFLKLPDQVGPARLATAALAMTAIGLAVIGLAPGSIGLIAGTAVFAAGVAFMFPALMSVAVSRVDETERGAVVGTTSAFLDVAFGIGPAVLGLVVARSGYPVAFLVSAAVAGLGAAIIVAARHRFDVAASALHSPS